MFVICQESHSVSVGLLDNLLVIITRKVQIQICSFIHCCLGTFSFFFYDFLRTSFEAGQHWNLVVLFCRVHKMEFPVDFLQDCAKDDRWLHFVCHAQTCQFPKEQVRRI